MEAVEALTRLGGVATLAELLGLTSRRRLRTALGTGCVVRIAPATYALPGADAARLAAARVGGVVSHLSAAEHWNWKVKLPPVLPSVTVPRRRCRLDADGIDLHWADLSPDQLCGRVTSKLQTVVDCSRAYDFGVALCVADSALRDGVSQSELIAAAEASPRTGRAKAVRVAKEADPRAANPFESAMRGITRDVPGLAVEPQQWIGGVGRADLVDKRLRVVIEAESFAFHSDRASLARDVHRYTGFVCLGWTVVRFTWEDVMFRPAYVHAVLVELVARGPAWGAVRSGST